MRGVDPDDDVEVESGVDGEGAADTSTSRVSLSYILPLMSSHGCRDAMRLCIEQQQFFRQVVVAMVLSWSYLCLRACAYKLRKSRLRLI